ncbi:MAG: hypothetical protein KF778_10080 [Rhodocyclaceae bacterium]|nr:hypothetical protein [Rhodocyclaceae bacterium]MBX3668737.1 hypothetical protein [Rhodocyclaceae bacterium]
MTYRIRPCAVAALVSTFALAACVTTGQGPVAASNNPSPTAGSSTSQTANAMADRAMYQPIEYVNRARPGPAVIVIPGEIKSSNATFTQKFGPNNIADFGELEMSNANFKVLERADLGPLLQEFQLAYTMGDPRKARRMLQKGKLRTTKYVVKFDVLKAEPVAQAQEGFDGRALGRVIGTLAGSRGGYAAGQVVGSVQTGEATGVWIIGMRYKIIDANTTEQKAQGYMEDKMEIGAKATSVMGVSSSAKGGLTLDTLVQRLVQKCVYDLDSKYK